LADHATLARQSFPTGPTRRVASRRPTTGESTFSIPAFTRLQAPRTKSTGSYALRTPRMAGPVARSSPCAAARERQASVQIRPGRGSCCSRTASGASPSAARPPQRPASVRTTSALRHRSPATTSSRSANREESSWETSTSGHLSGGRCSRRHRRTPRSSASGYDRGTGSAALYAAGWRMLGELA
jgi:hypothetical protein